MCLCMCGDKLVVGGVRGWVKCVLVEDGAGSRDTILFS